MSEQFVNLKAAIEAFEIVGAQHCFQFAADIFYSVAFGLSTLILICYTVFDRFKRVCLYAALFSAIQTSASALRAAASRNPQNTQVLIACYALQAFGPVIAIRILYRLFVSWCRLVSIRSPVSPMMGCVSGRQADLLFTIILAALIALCSYGASQRFQSRNDSTGITILRVASCIILFIAVSFGLMLLASMFWLLSSFEGGRDTADAMDFDREDSSSGSEYKKKLAMEHLTKTLLLKKLSAIYAFKALPDLLFSLGAILPRMLSSFDEDVYAKPTEVENGESYL